MATALSTLECTSEMRALEHKEAVRDAAGKISDADAGRVLLTNILGRGTWGTVWQGEGGRVRGAMRVVVKVEDDGEVSLDWPPASLAYMIGSLTTIALNSDWLAQAAGMCR
jgi:hypothetical protein